MFIAAVPPGIARRLPTDTRTHRPVVLGGFRGRFLPGGRELRACLESRVDAKLAAAARQTESTETVTRRDVIAGVNGGCPFWKQVSHQVSGIYLLAHVYSFMLVLLLSSFLYFLYDSL